MVSKAKLYTKLDFLETELKENLVPLLKRTVEGKNDFVFCVPGYNSFPELKSKTNEEMEALVNMGTQILALKNKLGESSEGSIAERICWYCREWGNMEDSHRKSAQALAKQFLEEIE